MTFFPALTVAVQFLLFDRFFERIRKPRGSFFQHQAS